MLAQINEWVNKVEDFNCDFSTCLRQPSPVLAWRIPGTEEPGGLPSLGWQRVGHDWSDLAAAESHLYGCP